MAKKKNSCSNDELQAITFLLQNAIGHSSKIDKSSVTFQWTPPSDHTGDVEFVYDCRTFVAVIEISLASYLCVVIQ